MIEFGVSRYPELILFGAGHRKSLAAVARNYGKRIFICSDERFAKDEMLAAIKQDLVREGLTVEVYEGTVAELPLSCILEAASAASDFGPDAIVGLGGGSCMDIAKLVAVLLAHGGPLSRYYGEFRVPGPLKPVIAIPTTAGTGSEVTPVAVLADPDRVAKIGISSPFLIPRVAICDPDLTLSCPPRLTAIAGADALTHAIEAFTARPREATEGIALSQVFVGKNAISDVHARAAIAALARNLEQAVVQGADADARAQVMFGALQAGLAFSAAGTAAAHAIQYPLGALTHTAHGLGVAALMPYVMEFNRSRCVPEFAEISRLFGVEVAGASDDDLSGKAIDAVESLMRRIGMHASLATLGLQESQQDAVARQSLDATRLVNNNREPLNEEAVRRIVLAAYAGDRSLLRTTKSTE